MVRSNTQAVAAAKKSTRAVPGTCQLWTRTQYQAPSAGDQDKDKDADANDGWASEPKSARVEGDRTPPLGAPLYFKNTDGTGFGHRCITVDNKGNCRSTDMSGGQYARGKVGNATIAQIEKAMKLTYVGWSRTITGIPIPGLEKPAPPKKPTTPSKPAADKPSSKPKPEKTGNDVVVSTNNVMSLPKNKELGKTLAASMTTPTIIGLQELDPASFKAVAEALPKWDLVDIPAGNNYAETILFEESEWELVGKKFVRQYNGVAGISYTRHFCVTRMHHKRLGFDAAFISFHQVTAGSDRNRKAMRAKALKTLRAEINRLRNLGLPVWVVGDYNTKAVQHPTANIKAVNGYDHIYFWNGRNVTATLDNTHAVDTASDHDAFNARFTLTVKK